jgi:REP-associated tyrosine transposase
LMGNSLPVRTGTTKIKPLGQLIGAFKTISAKKINQMRARPGMRVWQRNYYEHIIRNQNEYEATGMYILANPDNWAEDVEYNNLIIIPTPLRSNT